MPRTLWMHASRAHVGPLRISSRQPATLDVRDIRNWGPAYRDAQVVVYCNDGGLLSRGAAAWLRDEGAHAEVLTGGFNAWKEANQPLVRTECIPARDERGSTVWVTRQRPKIVRVACPWLIRRFVDPSARFLFVASPDVPAIAERFRAEPFDTGHGFWNDRGENCTSMSCSTRSV
jgi:rhodanese-related sulfurtransferase